LRFTQSSIQFGKLLVVLEFQVLKFLVVGKFEVFQFSLHLAVASLVEPRDSNETRALKTAPANAHLAVFLAALAAISADSVSRSNIGLFS
jgi:hypothetical protein